jgi:hypothetical protein
LDPSELSFEFSRDEPLPRSQVISVVKGGDVGKATPIGEWLKVTPAAKLITVSLLPDQLQRLGVGDHTGFVSVVPADGGDSVQVEVRLTVLALKPADARKEVEHKEEEKESGLGPTPPPPPPGCLPRGGAITADSFTVTGHLAAGATVEIQDKNQAVASPNSTANVSGRAPTMRRALRPVSIESQGAVAAEQWPTNENQCLPLRFKVGEVAIRTFTVRWELEPNK